MSIYAITIEWVDAWSWNFLEIIGFDWVFSDVFGTSHSKNFIHETFFEFDIGKKIVHIAPETTQFHIQLDWFQAVYFLWIK